ncbi:methyl-CpG-binding domain-containing protein 11-like [Hibiscus syriacus]|uniref:methyl-CpG-binding domain-containing protein 11-like n=1 Tax=Hibiscus syriacus TaxID=106335 RepID=UPI001921DB7D|nr:methyl-CpG-binding domain-containing protein 11-like [Hibiscus syriacus]
MVSSVEKKEMESGEGEAVCLELHAPPGWTKKKTGIPKKNDTIFIAPTGGEISSKRQLEQYLKANPGGPAVSEFDWGTGETPRRSARISEKVKAIPESTEPPRKQGRKSSASKKDNKELETVPEGTETKDVHMEEAGNKNNETRHGEDVNVSTNIKEGKENAEAVSEMLKGPQDGVEANASDKGFEDATSEVKLQQPVDEAEKGLGPEQHARPGIDVIAKEIKNEVVGEDKAKYESNTAESGGAIEETESIKCNEVQNITGVDGNSKKEEEAIRNGSNESNEVV